MKRFASHYLRLVNGDFLKLHIVEIGEEGFVVRFFPLTEEVESVSWLSGVISLAADEQGRQTATHLYPFNFEEMQPADETRRTPLP